MDITENLSFYCKCCDNSWNRKYDFEQHMKTKKHTKNTINIPKNPTKREKTIIKNFHCDCCQFTCTTKKNARQHIINNHKNYTFVIFGIIVILMPALNFLPHYVHVYFIENIETFYLATGALMVVHLLLCFSWRGAKN